MDLKLSEREIKVAIVSAFITIIVSIGMLDYKGYIQHSNPEDGAVIAEFKLLSLNQGSALKVSPKSSGKTAVCNDGYLLIRPDNDRNVAGILVDARNRGINCSLSQF